jgi:hypothetical protein
MKSFASTAVAATIALACAIAPLTTKPAAALSPAGVTSHNMPPATANNLLTEVRHRHRSRLVIIIRPPHRHCWWTTERVCTKWRHHRCVRTERVLVRVCR